MTNNPTVFYHPGPLTVNEKRCLEKKYSHQEREHVYARVRSWVESPVLPVPRSLLLYGSELRLELDPHWVDYYEARAWTR